MRVRGITYGWVATALLLLSGCVTTGTTPYQAYEQGGGYREQWIGGNRWQVEVAGSTATTRETLIVYWLYRCAELSLEKGFEYFAVMAAPSSSSEIDKSMRTADTVDDSGRQIVLAKGGGGTFIPIFVPERGSSVPRWAARGIIEMHKTPASSESYRVYSAKEIADALGPAVKQASQSGESATLPAGLLTQDAAPSPSGGASGSGVRLDDLESLLPKD